VVDKEDGVDSKRSKTEECESMAVKLEELVDEWSGLVRMGGFERQPDQLQLIRSHIGPIPPPEEAARRVGSLYKVASS
jgi:hypothetical protein